MLTCWMINGAKREKGKRKKMNGAERKRRKRMRMKEMKIRCASLLSKKRSYIQYQIAPVTYHNLHTMK